MTVRSRTAALRLALEDVATELGLTVKTIEVSADQVAETSLSLQDGESATLIVTGTTRYTRKNSVYQFEIK